MSKVMKVRDLKNIINNLCNDYTVVVEDFDNPGETVNILSVEIAIDTNQVILKNWERTCEE